MAFPQTFPTATSSSSFATFGIWIPPRPPGVESFSSLLCRRAREGEKEGAGRKEKQKGGGGSFFASYFPPPFSISPPLPFLLP